VTERIDPDDQLAMDEVLIEDSEAEEALEERLRARLALAPLKRAYKEAHEAAKFAVLRHAGEIADGGSVRIGRFRVSKRLVKGRSVAFETEERTQLSFATLEERSGDEPPEQKVARFRGAPKKAHAIVDADGRATGYQVN